MRKITISLVGLMDLGTLDAIKSVSALKDSCVPSPNNEPVFSSKLFKGISKNKLFVKLSLSKPLEIPNEEVQDKSGHITEKEGQPLSACL